MNLLVRALGRLLFDLSKAVVGLAIFVGICLLVSTHPVVAAMIVSIIIFVAAMIHYVDKLEEEDRTKAHRDQYHEGK